MIKIEKIDRVMNLKVDIPPVNVLDTENCRELTENVRKIQEDKTVAAIVISGEGKCFSAGASVEEHKKELAPQMIGAFADTCRSLASVAVPTVALVHGFCFGGALELTMYCDMVLADPSAKLSIPEISLAFFPPFACSILSSIVGRQNAAHLILTGETIDAQRAHSIGLVQKIIPRDQWDREISKFNRLSIPVLRLAKEAFRKGMREGEADTLTPILNDYFLDRLYKIEDVAEGIASFNEKRKPEWKHR
jgi:enoyl-CoA hydratase/carnithine racemase